MRGRALVGSADCCSSRKHGPDFGPPGEHASAWYSVAPAFAFHGGRRTNQTACMNCTTALFAGLVRAAQAARAGPPQPKRFSQESRRCCNRTRSREPRWLGRRPPCNGAENRHRPTHRERSKCGGRRAIHNVKQPAGGAASHRRHRRSRPPHVTVGNVGTRAPDVPRSRAPSLMRRELTPEPAVTTHMPSRAAFAPRRTRRATTGTRERGRTGSLRSPDRSPTVPRDGSRFPRAR
jgi:hypothetical protein